MSTASTPTGMVTCMRLAWKRFRRAVSQSYHWPLVSEAGLRILNTPGSTASYRVLLPSSITSVRVRVGAGAPVEVTAEDLSNGWVVELGAR